MQKHVQPDESGQLPQNDLDALMELCQEIEAAFEFTTLSAMPLAMWIKSEFIPVFSLEHLDQQHLFISVLRLTYKVGV